MTTRSRVARTVLEDGPITASELATRLGLTPAAVRRHLDVMLADGLVTVRRVGPVQRRRGRPAKAFVLTDAGHAAMTTTYDDLAVSALRYLAAQGGREAVEAFAADRVADLEHRYAAQVAAAGDSTVDRVELLASALSSDGFAASTRPVSPNTPHQAVQLCQGHCPVQSVATEFPELCEAETQAFARLLGVDVRRLATLAGGAHVCTTHVPVGAGRHPPPRDARPARKTVTTVTTSGRTADDH